MNSSLWGTLSSIFVLGIPGSRRQTDEELVEEGRKVWAGSTNLGAASILMVPKATRWMRSPRWGVERERRAPRMTEPWGTPKLRVGREGRGAANT